MCTIVALTRDQKRKLGDALIFHVAQNMLASVGDGTGYMQEISDLPYEEIRLQLSKWLSKIPANHWDKGLVPMDEL